MLMTMTEFEAFKELILSYKQENMETAKSIDMTLSTNGLHIYKDEQVRACTFSRPDEGTFLEMSQCTSAPRRAPDLALSGTHEALPLEDLDNLYGVAPAHQTD